MCANLVKEGWLTKLGGHGLKKGWKRRWFILTDDAMLKYYGTKKDKAPKGELNLKKYVGVEKTTEEGNKPLCVKILHEDQASNTKETRNFFMHCDKGAGEELRDAWIAEISKFLASKTEGEPKREEEKNEESKPSEQAKEPEMEMVPMNVGGAIVMVPVQKQKEKVEEPPSKPEETKVAEPEEKCEPSSETVQESSTTEKAPEESQSTGEPKKPTSEPPTPAQVGAEPKKPTSEPPTPAQVGAEPKKPTSEPPTPAQVGAEPKKPSSPAPKPGDGASVKPSDSVPAKPAEVTIVKPSKAPPKPAVEAPKPDVEDSKGGKPEEAAVPVSEEQTNVAAEEELSALKVEVEREKAELEALQKEKGDLENAVRSSQLEMDDLQVKVDGFGPEKEALEAKVKELEGAVQAAFDLHEAECVKLRTEASTVEKSMASEILVVGEKITATEERKQVAIADRERIEAEVSSVEALVSELESMQAEPKKEVEAVSAPAGEPAAPIKEGKMNDALVVAEPEPVKPVVVAEPEPEPVKPVVVAEPEPEPVKPVVVAEPEPEPVKPVVVAEPEPEPVKPVVVAEPEPEPVKPVVVAEPVKVAPAPAVEPVKETPAVSEKLEAAPSAAGSEGAAAQPARVAPAPAAKTPARRQKATGPPKVVVDGIIMKSDGPGSEWQQVRVVCMSNGYLLCFKGKERKPANSYFLRGYSVSSADEKLDRPNCLQVVPGVSSQPSCYLGVSSAAEVARWKDGLSSVMEALVKK